MKDIFIVNSKTDIYAILGDPIYHSLSPVIQNSAFRKFNLNSVFIALRCRHDHIDEMMNALKEVNLKGYVFTMPLKEMVSKHLDELRDEAELTGAVNCVINESGKLIGYNTDSIGFWNAISEKNVKHHKINKIFVMGMGGFSKAAVAQAAIQGVKKIIITNKMDETKYVTSFQDFIKKLKSKIRNLDIKLIDWDITLWKDELKNVDLVVNATPNGLNGIGNLHIQFPYDYTYNNAIFFDAVYTPIKSLFLCEAEKKNHIIVNGLDLLAHQGAVSFKLWTNKYIDPDVMRSDAIKFLK